MTRSSRSGHHKRTEPFSEDDFTSRWLFSGKALNNFSQMMKTLTAEAHSCLSVADAVILQVLAAEITSQRVLFLLCGHYRIIDLLW
jgi:hypothetical protein